MTKKKVMPTEKERPVEKNIVRPDGCTVYYDRLRHDPGPGDKTDRIPIVFIHGNGEDRHSFARQFDAFGGVYDYIAPDCRGRGRSEFGTTPLTIPLLTDDIIAVMAAEGIEKAHILGFSDGGNIAVDLALRRPDLAASLICVGANLTPDGVIAKYQTPTVISYYLESLGALFSRKAAKRKQLLSLMVNEPHFAPEDLNKIAAPTLVIAGEHDMIKTEHTRLIAASIPGAALEIIPGGDHFVMMRMPDVFNKTVSAFLEKQHTEKSETGEKCGAGI